MAENENMAQGAPEPVKTAYADACCGIITYISANIAPVTEAVCTALAEKFAGLYRIAYTDGVDAGISGFAAALSAKCLEYEKRPGKDGPEGEAIRICHSIAEALREEGRNGKSER